MDTVKQYNLLMNYTHFLHKHKVRTKLQIPFFSLPRQTLFLTLLMRTLGNKNTVLLGLGFQILQLAWYGFGSEPW